MSEEMIQMKGSVIENGETTKLKKIIEVDLFRDFFETDEPTTEQINEWKKNSLKTFMMIMVTYFPSPIQI